MNQVKVPSKGSNVWFTDLFLQLLGLRSFCLVLLMRELQVTHLYAVMQSDGAPCRHAASHTLEIKWRTIWI